MTNFFASLATAVDPAGEIAAWVPATILASLCLALLTFVGRGLLKRLEMLEEKIGGKPFATKEDLGNMGDRFDERHGTMRERQAIAEVEARALTERVKRLEGAE